MQPYKVITVKDNYHEFTTAAGTKYACYFLSYAGYFDEYKEISGRVYGFNVEQISKGKKAGADPRIGYTVVHVVKAFLNELVNAVVYVCDNADSRELMRKRKFDTWFKQYDDGSIIKIDGHIVYGDLDIYNAILIHKENQKKNRFIEAFTQLNQSGDNK